MHRVKPSYPTHPYRRHGCNHGRSARRGRCLPRGPVPTNIGCDPIDPAACLLPFPNDFFTAADATTDTGRRINFSPTAMPRNGAEVTEGGEGKPVDPTEWNRNDGFSPGSAVMTYVPGPRPAPDLGDPGPAAQRGRSERAGLLRPPRPHRRHRASTSEPDAPIVILNAETGERHPFWSELDTHPGAARRRADADPAPRDRTSTRATRYIVALRESQGRDGHVIAARSRASPPPYKSGHGCRRDSPGRTSTTLFPVARRGGYRHDDLYLAWDFTVASERNLAERMLHIRDDAFAQLGDTDLGDRIVQGTSPEFVDRLRAEERTTTGPTRTASSTSDHRSAASTGRVTVPNYLDRPQQTTRATGRSRPTFPVDAPAPGSRFLDIDLDGLPDQNPVESTVTVPFTCECR